MTDPPPDPDRGDQAGDRGSATSTRRWPTVIGIIIAIALILLIVVLHLTGTIGPGAH